MKVLLVGPLDPIDKKISIASSSAANQVVSEISSSLRRIVDRVFVFAYKPSRTWPYGSMFSKEVNIDECFWPRILNIYGLRKLSFAFKLVFEIPKRRSNIIVIYNPSFLESIAVRIAKCFVKQCRLVAVIQDVHFVKGEVPSLRGVSDLLAMMCVRRFDLIIPISEKIISDFKFDPSKCIRFRGGLTRQGQEFVRAVSTQLAPIATFAGALEGYNGIDELVKRWVELDTDLVLHIFGKGSCSDVVRRAAEGSPSIVFHGHTTEEEVFHYQRMSMMNFCLRFPIGIDPGYFFPSKLFNLACAPGLLVINNFPECPMELKKHCFVLDSDWSNFHVLTKSAVNLISISDDRLNRIAWVRKNANWDALIASVIDRIAG